MKLFNTYTFTISFLLGTTLAEFNWDYGNWSPILGPCLSCNPSNVFESKSNIHSSFGESNSRGRQLQFAQAQPAFIQQEGNDADNSLDQIQLVYLPEGSLRELRSAKVARVLESQLRPVRQASLQNFEEFERGSFNQQLPSFREISPKRPTALIAERGKELEAQQQIDLLEAALNSQHENVKPGELPRVFIAPTHIPPPPGYVKIPLLPSQNSVQNRQTLPGTFLTSEFHSQLPHGFVQLPLPQNVAHLSHDIPFVHPDSNPLLLAHFSPASTLRGSPISQNRPAERQNELRTSVQEPTQFSGSVRGSNQNELRTPVQEPNQFPSSVRGSNQNELRTPVQEPNQFLSSVRGSNQNELRTPVQELNQFPSSVRGSNQNEQRTPVQEPNQFPSSVRGSNQNELRTPVQEPNQFPSSVRGSDQVRTSTRESSNQFPSPNLELNQVRIAPSSLLRQPEGRHPLASSADQSGQSQNFGQIPVAASVGFTESNFGFNDGLGKQNVQSDPNIDFTSDPFIQPNEVRVQQTARQPSHRFQIGTPVISPTEIFAEEEKPLADDSRFQTNQFNQENNFGFQEEKINVFDAPELPTQTFESSHIQKNQRERLIPRPVSNEGQLLRESVTPKQQLNADSHFFTNEASGVTFEEVDQTLTPLPETSLAEEHSEDLLTPFRLSPKPVSGFPSHSFSPDSSNTLPTTTEFELELTTSLPELIISTSLSTEEKALESSTASELPSSVRTRGRKRIRPDATRTRGRLQNRNRINAIQSEDLGKNDLKVTSGVPEENQNEHALDNTVTSTPGRLANRARVPARRPRPNKQRVAPAKSEVAESAATAEESTLFPPFSIARQQSSQNKGSDNVETVSPQRKDSSLLRGRFGSRTRSKIHEANEDKPNVVSAKNENTITEEAVHATSTTSESDVINREQAGVRNRGRPVPEWLKNRRRTRVLSRVRKVDPSDVTATTPDVSDSLISETDLKGAESASFLISQPAEGKVSEQNEQTLIDNKHTDAKDSEKTKFYNIPTDNLESTVGNFELAVDLETTTENIFDDILETLHLEKATEETPIEVATLKYLNENENLPAVELHEELTEQKVDEGYVDSISNPTLPPSPVENSSFGSEPIISQNRDELEHSSRTDTLKDSERLSPFDTLIDFVSHSSTNSKPEISSSFSTSSSQSSDVSQNIESHGTHAEDPNDIIAADDDNYFDNFFDISSTDDKLQLRNNINVDENSATNESFVGSSAHIVYAVALNEAPIENSLKDSSKLESNFKETTEASNLDYETTEEVTVETTTRDSRFNEPEETVEIQESPKFENETFLTSQISEQPSNASTLNFLESFFSNKSRPAKDLENEVREFKEGGRTVIGESTVTEVRSSAPVICYSEGNCVIGTGLRKKRNS